VRGQVLPTTLAPAPYAGDTARAMSQENVERAREGYATLSLAIRAGDLDAYFSEFVHPEIEWVPMDGGPDVAVATGHEPVKARLTAMFEVMGQPEIEAEEILDAGEKVFVAIRISGRGRGSGLDMEARWFHVLTDRDGKLARIEWYATRAEALEAAGLSE
jgi:ketosteroid isomerase-like protein